MMMMALSPDGTAEMWMRRAMTSSSVLGVTHPLSATTIAARNVPKRYVLYVFSLFFSLFVLFMCVLFFIFVLIVQAHEASLASLLPVRGGAEAAEPEAAEPAAATPEVCSFSVMCVCWCSCGLC